MCFEAGFLSYVSEGEILTPLRPSYVLDIIIHRVSLATPGYDLLSSEPSAMREINVGATHFCRNCFFPQTRFGGMITFTTKVTKKIWQMIEVNLNVCMYIYFL